MNNAALEFAKTRELLYSSLDRQRITITSGIRTQRENASLLLASPTSAHLWGGAIDFNFKGPYFLAATLLHASKLWDQVILYKQPFTGNTFIHVGRAVGKSRGEFLFCVHDGAKKRLITIGDSTTASVCVTDYLKAPLIIENSYTSSSRNNFLQVAKIFEEEVNSYADREVRTKKVEVASASPFRANRSFGLRLREERSRAAAS